MRRRGQQVARQFTIERWNAVAQDKLLPSLEALFFTTSRTKDFASESERRAFQDRWLGRYLLHDPHLAHLALLPGGTLAGYLVGCLEDPALTPRFSDLSYFQEFAAYTRHFPAHLHVNVAPGWQGRGIGSALIGAFAACAAAGGAAGVHVITAQGHENKLFYLRQGFQELAETRWRQRRLVFLGRSLTQV